MVLVDSLGGDLEKIPKPDRYRKPGLLVSFFASLGSILLFSTLIFTTINFPSLYKIAKYNLRPKAFAKEAPQIVSPGSLTEAPPIKQYADNTLFIPKIGVEAPISWNVEEADILDVLPNGLAQIDGTAKPGEGKNIFITGHSSNYWWRKGDYNSVFALLPELNQGDEIFINYQGKLRKYIVSDKREISPKAAGNFVSSAGEQVTLMTCVPIGTNLRRLLVIAKPS